MNKISFQLLTIHDKDTIRLIAEWYMSEWNIPVEKTIHDLSHLPVSGIPFQVIMLLDGNPIATGGLYHRVALLDREPTYKKYDPWLALVYTIPENRNKGYGALLCKEIQSMARALGHKEIFLYTHTAESLYKRLDWQEMERTTVAGKQIVIMNKRL
jgi:GNAT superfamily N-acetyltransferase